MEIIGGGRYYLKKKKKTTCKDSCSVTYLGDRKWERGANILNPGVTAQLERGSTYSTSWILGLGRRLPFKSSSGGITKSTLDKLSLKSL